MTVEELLKPRYKVIAEWPGNTKYSVGDILKGYSPGCGGGEIIRNDKGESGWLSVEKHPHLFKKLEWWEDREEKDMPEYVINNIKTAFEYKKIYKVHKYMYNNIKAQLEDTFYPVYLNLNNTLPATKEEYETQKQTP